MSIRPGQEGTFSMSSSHSPERLAVAFDDDHAVANAALLLPAASRPHPSSSIDGSRLSL
jgi:hypothetical protein